LGEPRGHFKNKRQAREREREREREKGEYEKVLTLVGLLQKIGNET
jgi:hypothetical protein